MQSNLLKTFIQATKEYRLGTRWLRFHALCRLPLIGILYTCASIAPFFNNQNIQIVNMLCWALNGILCLVAIYPTIRLRPSAYPLNIAVAAGMVLYGLVSFSIPIIGLEMLEIYYFIKREDLFRPKNN